MGKYYCFFCCFAYAKNVIKYMRILSVCLCAIIAFVLIYVLDITQTLNKQWMDTFVRHAGMQGMLTYVGLVAMLTALGIPRQACALLGGYVFGMWTGTLLATIGTAISCLLCFSYARFLGQKWLKEKYGHKMQNFTDFICQSPFLLTVVVRIIPLGSNFLTNFIAGISPIPAFAFLGGSTLGFTVQNFIFASMGSGLNMGGSVELFISALLYVVSLSLGYWIYKKYKQHKVKSPLSETP